MTIRSLLAPFAVAVFVAHAGQAFAQGAFPALPNQIQQNDPAFPPVPGQPVQRSDPAFPPVNGRAPAASVGAPPMSPFPANGAAPISGGFASAPPPPQGGPPADCMKQFVPLREDAERRGKAIKAASDRHAAPDVACKLIGGYSQAELKMIGYIEKNSARCGIPAQVGEQLKNNHKSTEVTLKKVCEAAQQAQQRGPAGPTLSDVLGSAAALPEATPRKKGGSTFDTLNGNVLTR